MENNKLYKNLNQFDASKWQWPHFSAKELSCKCNKYCEGEYYHSPQFLDSLENLRKYLGAPIEINSARRCAVHNRIVGGVINSMHTKQIAVDIKINPHSRVKLYEGAQKAGFSGLGFGVNFMHLDLGPNRRWTYSGALGLWKRALGLDPLKQ